MCSLIRKQDMIRPPWLKSIVVSPLHDPVVEKWVQPFLEDDPPLVAKVSQRHRCFGRQRIFAWQHYVQRRLDQFAARRSRVMERR